MSSLEDEPTLEVALERLMQAFSTPVVPGELVSWAETAVAASRRVESALADQIKTIHPGLFDQIAQEDPELLTHVEHMRSEDEAQLAAAEHLAAKAEQIQKAADAVEPREDVMEEAIERFNEAALELFAQINKQEAAIATWLQEALQRDRGPVD